MALLGVLAMARPARNTPAIKAIPPLFTYILIEVESQCIGRDWLGSIERWKGDVVLSHIILDTLPP